MKMAMPFIKKRVSILLAASVGMYFLTGQVLESDSAAPAVRAFVISDERVVGEVGAVQDVKIIKRVAVGSTATSDAYRLYTVDIRGARAAATAVIKLQGAEGDGSPTLETVVR